MVSKIDLVELKSAIRRAVSAKIAVWDSEHDIEDLFDGDEIDVLSDIINNAAAVCSPDMSDTEVIDIANEIIEAHAEQRKA